MFDIDRNVRPSQSRREKREDRYKWACLKRLQDDIPDVNFTKQKVRGLQDKVSGIQNLRKKCPEHFVEHDGLLYHLWTPRQQPTGTVEQLILPEQFHRMVCKLAHTIPLAGHLGRDKTTERISRWFFWLSMF